MVFEKIRKLAVEQLSRDESEITMDTDLQKDLDADSLDIFQIMCDIEDEFDIRIEETSGIKTVGDVVRLVESLM